MLNIETAQSRLRAYHIVNWTERRLTDIAGLPASLQGLGYGLLGYASNAKQIESSQLARAAQHQAIEQLDDLTVDERIAVFDAVLPGLGQHVEEAWQLTIRMPYQVGATRMAFRAPTKPVTSLLARGTWLIQLIEIIKGYEQPIAWFAEWAVYLGKTAPEVLGALFAGTIEAGGSEGQTVYDILVASAQGKHEIGGMGRHVTRGALRAG